ELIASNRYELEAVGKLIGARLKALKGGRSRRDDDAFGWGERLRTHDLPPDLEEEASDLFEKRDFQRAEPLFLLLTECFPDYAEGHNYLGSIALERGKLAQAVA